MQILLLTTNLSVKPRGPIHLERHECSARARSSLEQSILAGDFPPDYTLGPLVGPPPISEVFAILSPIYLMIESGQQLVSEIYYNRQDACDPREQEGYALCQEPFRGRIPSMESGEFPSTIPIQIAAAQASGAHKSDFSPDQLEKDVLAIKIQLNVSNLNDVAEYFSGSYSKNELLQTDRQTDRKKAPG